jgi:hypothetical protein
MQAQARQVHVPRLSCRLESRQDKPKSVGVLRPNATCASGFKEYLQPLVGPSPDHDRV